NQNHYQSLLNYLLILTGIRFIVNLLRKISPEGIEKNEACQALITSKTVPGYVYLSLSVFQAIASAGTGIVITMGAIALVHLSSGDQAWTGVPVALVLGISALISLPLATWKDKRGYGRKLLFASVIGLTGSLLCVASILFSIKWPMLLGFICIGAATCAIFLSRFAAIEMTNIQQRGKALSIVMSGATVGAIAAPLIASLTSSVSQSIEIELITPFLITGAAYCLGFFLLKYGIPSELLNEPLLQHSAMPSVDMDKSKKIFSLNISIIMICVVAAQASRVLLMAVAPIYMQSLNFSTETISILLSIFFIGMYGTSVISGWLTDKIGRTFVIIIGAITLILSYGLIILDTKILVVTVALFLLGMGWNFCFISSSVILMDFSKGENAGKIQGLNDVLVNIAAGIVSIIGGLILVKYQIAGIAIVGSALSVIPILALIYLAVGNKSSHRTAATVTTKIGSASNE
ncbi:MAG: MFS transporter, partial [Cellvibrionales bacterium]|nr:MFS transporter [Cellvibrionales bacterium]